MRKVGPATSSTKVPAKVPAKASVRRDPAPSRLLYRLERWWLRPLTRFTVRIGMPIMALLLLAVSAVRDPDVQDAAARTLADLRAQIAAHPALQVTTLRLEGVGAETEARMRAVLALDLPVSSMDLDLSQMQSAVMQLDAVRDAHVRVEAGVLTITARERRPVIIWRTPTGLDLLDVTGARVDGLPRRADRADLPMMTGIGADTAIAEALELIRIAGPIRDRLRGLQRVGARRWRLVLTDNMTIELPEEAAAAALARVMGLHAGEGILALDLRAVDMRDSRRPILRLTPRALLEVRRGRGLAPEEDA